ncbi:MAG TPA: DUF4272 domain-containing protein, partial [Verrucomicrobiae bacterium]
MIWQKITALFSTKENNGKATPTVDDWEGQRLAVTQRIVKRIFCLSACACRANLEGGAGHPDAQAVHKQIRPWLKAVNAEADLEPWEAKLLDKPLGKLEPAEHVKSSWCGEGVVLLAWALQLFPLPPHDKTTSGQEIARRMHFLQPDALKLVAMANLRSQAELKEMKSKVLTIHWRLREFNLRSQPINFPEVTKRGIFNGI